MDAYWVVIALVCGLGMFIIGEKDGTTPVTVNEGDVTSEISSSPPTVDKKLIPEIKINDSGDIMTDVVTELTENQTVYFRKFHNAVRRNVQPTAGNMKRLQWDLTIANNVARRVTTCAPLSAKDEADNINVGISEDSTGQQAMEEWLKESANYDIETKICSGQCSRYTRMVWAASDRIGCAIQKCGVHHLVACAYESLGNLVGELVYLQGPPCSVCRLPWELCYRGLCVKAEVCYRQRLTCNCTIEKCYNCGVLSTRGTCFCECGEGFDGADCSLPCANEHPFCTHHPGYNHARVCALGHSSVRDVRCRKMCGRCRELTTEKSKCCNGKTCPKGSALLGDCTCIGICPGPMCGSFAPSLQPSLLLTLISISLSLYRLAHG